MKYTVSKKALNSALIAANRYKESHTIGSVVRLKARGGNLFEILSTDGDNEIEYTIKTGTTIERGEIVVNAELIKSAVDSISDDTAEITLETKEMTAYKCEGDKPQIALLITGANIDLQIRASDVELEYLILQQSNKKLFDVSFEMHCDEMADTLSKLASCISEEEFRYYINGMFFHRENRGSNSFLRMVVTDGHRLCMVERPLPAGAEKLPVFNLLPRKKFQDPNTPEAKARARREERRIKDTQCRSVPKRTCLQMQKLIGKRDDFQIHCHFSDKWGRFMWHTADRSIVLSTKLVDGIFPNYKHIIPKDNQYRATVNSSYMTEAMESIRKIRKKNLIVDITKEDIFILVNFNEYGETLGQVKKELSAVMQHTEPMQIGLNKRYLEEYVKACGKTYKHHHKMTFNSPNDPVEFWYGNYYFLVMPYRL